MASPQGSSELRSAKSTPRKLASTFQRHQLKFLNLGLVIYLCFGVFVFELLGEFSQDAASTGSDIVRKPSNSTAKRRDSLAELRESSARRMWNITNRLNILYESNWTRLMLDELQEFERQLLDKLMEEANSDLANKSSEQGDEEDEEEEEGDDDRKDSEKKKNERKSRNRLKSLKKSLIHSLSTITTVGFSERIQSSAGKLATVIYGLLGIPLLVCSVAKTGSRVAHSALNGLLIVRHYCISLPLHYLCCSCSLGACFRCLLWCCCCCCCSYLCCCLPSRKDKDKCCDSSKAPKLRLRKRRRRGENRSRDGATSTAPDQDQRTAYVIGATSSGADSQEWALEPRTHHHQQQQQQQKSVRFVSNANNASQSAEMEKQGYAESDDEDDESYYTQGVFLTSLSALSLYLLVGAYFYAAHTNSPLIDALFVCYSMLSTSKLAGQSTQSEQIYSDPRTLYEHLNATGTSMAANATESIESETIKWLYLLIGLNLISACGHFGQLWLSNKLRLAECPVAAASKKSVTCNGQLSHSFAANFQAAPDQQLAGSAPSLANELKLAAPNAGQIIGPNDYNNLTNHQHNIFQSQQQTVQSQVDLSELFLVQSQPEHSAGELQFQAQAQPVGQTPDMSLNSDRSTDRGSLCHHHHQLQQHAHQNSNEPSNSYAHSVYNVNTIKQHHRHPSQSHLYLPPLQTLDCVEPVQQQQQLGNRFILPGELSCDEADEMHMLLKSCNGTESTANRLRSSSSSTQLSHLSGPLQQQQQHQHQHIASAGTTNSSSTISRVRTSFDKQNGQDSSQNNTLNDGSNTISSTNSSRTVKLPHMRSNQHIGFILAPEHQSGLNEQ